MTKALAGTGVASGPVWWYVSPAKATVWPLPMAVKAQTWFEAREFGRRAYGCEARAVLAPEGVR